MDEKLKFRLMVGLAVLVLVAMAIPSLINHFHDLNLSESGPVLRPGNAVVSSSTPEVLEESTVAEVNLD